MIAGEYKSNISNRGGMEQEKGTAEEGCSMEVSNRRGSIGIY